MFIWIVLCSVWSPTRTLSGGAALPTTCAWTTGSRTRALPPVRCSMLFGTVCHCIWFWPMWLRTCFKVPGVGTQILSHL